MTDGFVADSTDRFVVDSTDGFVIDSTVKSISVEI